MIRLRSLEIKNYRSCLNTKLKITKDLICLIGLNASGKSNILNSMLLISKANLNYIGRGNRRRFNKKETKSDLSCVLDYDGKKIFIKYRFSFETEEGNSERVTKYILLMNLRQFGFSKKWITVPLDIIFQFKRHFRNSRQDILINELTEYINISNKGLIKPLSNDQVKIINDALEFLTNISYYSASQFSDPSKSPIYLELEERPFSRTSHDKFLRDLYYSFKNNSKLFVRYFSIVGKDGMRLIDKIEFKEYKIPSSSIEVKSGGKVKKIEKDRQLIIPFITIDKSELSPNQLSEGTYKSLALVFYILTDKNPLLLIEEPEVCVHHGLLNSLISIIIEESRQKQIIISTHSDFILDKLKPDNIIIVKKSEQSGTFTQTLKQAFKKADYNALKDYLATSGNLGEYWKEGGFGNE